MPKSYFSIIFAPDTTVLIHKTTDNNDNRNHHFSRRSRSGSVGRGHLQQPRQAPQQPRERFRQHRRTAQAASRPHTPARGHGQRLCHPRKGSAHARHRGPHGSHGRPHGQRQDCGRKHAEHRPFRTARVARSLSRTEGQPELPPASGRNLRCREQAGRHTPLLQFDTRELNNAVQTFPSNLLAGMFGFRREPMFEIPQADRATLDKAPEISF